MSIDNDTAYLSRDPMSLMRRHLLERYTDPTVEPLTLAETKAYLRVDSSDEDALIGDCIVSARVLAEMYLRRSLIDQSWMLAYDDGLADCVLLPMGPVNAITSVTSFARDGSTQVIGSSAYALNAAKDALLNYGGISGQRVEIIYTAGYGGVSDVPKPLKQGMLAHIAIMYDSRGEIAVMPQQTFVFYRAYREVSL